MPYAIAYLILVNAISLLLMHRDKRNAIRHGPRVPEAVLLGLALFGGSVGSVAGMFLFHHKTRKPLFSMGLPLLLLMHIGVFLFHII